MMFGSNVSPDSPIYALPLATALGVYMTLQSIWLAFFATVLVVVLIGLHSHGRLAPVWGSVRGGVGWVYTRLATRLTDTQPVAKGLLFIGRNLDTGERVLLDMATPSSLGIFAQTGGGKSTLVETILAELATQCSPTDVRVCVSDPSGVDYRIWDRLPHLAYPIVDIDGTLGMLQWVADQKHKREALFATMPRDRKCNNLPLYHKLRDQLSLRIPRLPVMVVILDEIQDVTIPGSESERIVKDLVRTGRKFGIVVWGITQRNTVGALSRDIQQQMPWKLIGYMPDNQDYASIGRVPKDVYSRMKQTPGRFMGFVGGGWFHLQARMIPPQRVETIARRHSLSKDVPYPTTLATADAPPQVKKQWRGTPSQKEAMLVEWLLTQPTKPTPEDFMEVFDASRNTGLTWVDRCWPLVESKRKK